MTGVHLNGDLPIALCTKRLAKLHARLMKEFGFDQAPATKPTTSTNGAGTGNSLTDAELIAKAKAAKNGAKFTHLWAGDWKAAGYTSQSEADLALCGILAFWTDCDTARIDALFRQSGLMRRKWDRTDYRDGTIAKAIAGKTETYKPTAPVVATEGQPSICLTAPKLDTVIKQSIAALRDANKAEPRFFVQGRRMVTVVKDDKGRMAITEACDRFLRPELERCADYYVRKKNGEKAAAWPTLDVAQSILARPQVEWGLPSLRGVVMGPVLRPGGTLVTESGYDKALRLYYAPQAKLELPAIPEKPTQEQCAEAAEKVGQILVDFPFVEAADRANFYALLLTPFLRHLVDKVPLALVDSAQKGTGKTLLAEVLGILHQGQEPTMWPPPFTQEDWAKILTTILLSGSPITVFDNLEYTLHSPVLAKILTSTEHSDRMMRTHEEMRIPNTTVFVVTGNNIRVAGDLDRRCYRMRMVSPVAQPWKRRKFQIGNLKTYVREHRGELLAALLTMIRGWYAAGRPIPRDKDGKAPNGLGGGFEEWSRRVGRILAYAGVEGFLANQNKLYQEANPDEGSWERFLAKAYDKYGSGGFLVATLIKDVEWGKFPKDALPEDRGFELYRGDLDPKKVAGALQRQREKISVTKKLSLVSQPQPNGRVLWVVKRARKNRGVARARKTVLRNVANTRRGCPAGGKRHFWS
jgi:hypothetical protein